MQAYSYLNNKFYESYKQTRLTQLYEDLRLAPVFTLLI